MSNEQRLLDLKQMIDQMKNEKARVEGVIQQLFKNLKEEFGLTSMKEATKRLEELSVEVEEQKEKLNASLNKLEELLDEPNS